MWVLSRRLTQARITVAGLIRVRIDSLSSRSVEKVLPGSLGSRGLTLARLRVSGFIRDRLGSLNTPKGCRDYSGSLGFTRASISVASFIRVRLSSLRPA